MKSLKDIKQLHQIRAGVTLKRLNVTMNGMVLGEAESEEIATWIIKASSVVRSPETLFKLALLGAAIQKHQYTFRLK